MSDTGQSAACASQDDRDLTSIADVIDDPARAAMLAALAGGRALPAGELARRAGVQPTAASAHLRRLTEAGLIKVRAQGRHRYHEIVDPEIAMVLEVIAQIAPPAPVHSLPEQQAACALSEARTCYDHLAGRRGVQLRDRLLAVGAIRGLDDRDHELTDRGQDLVGRLGIDLAGALPAAITSEFLARGWLTPGPGRRLRVGDDFDGNIEKWLAI